MINLHPLPVTCPPDRTHSNPFLPTPALLLNRSILACSTLLAINAVGNPDTIVAFWWNSVWVGECGVYVMSSRHDLIISFHVPSVREDEAAYTY